LPGVVVVFTEKQETSAGQDEENDVGYSVLYGDSRHRDNRTGWDVILVVAVGFLNETQPTDDAKWQNLNPIEHRISRSGGVPSAATTCPSGNRRHTYAIMINA